MMTTEMVQNWFKEYEEKKRHLTDEYDLRFDRLPVNRFGEVSASALLELNSWYEEQETKIKAEMMKKMVEA